MTVFCIPSPAVLVLWFCRNSWFQFGCCVTTLGLKWFS